MDVDVPPNLDDGELWLPSDVIRAVGVCHHHHHRLAAVDDLAQTLASLQVLDDRRTIPTVKPFKDSSFYPEVQFQGQGRPNTLLSPVNGGCKAPIRRRVATVTPTELTGAFFPVSRTVRKFRPALPIDFHVERFRLARARVLQKQRQQHDHELNRFTPTRSSGPNRKTSGTGVFLPRVYRVDSKRKAPIVKGNAQFQQSMWNPVLGKQAAKFLPSSEVGLPQDWTY